MLTTFTDGRLQIIEAIATFPREMATGYSSLCRKCSVERLTMITWWMDAGKIWEKSP